MARRTQKMRKEPRTPWARYLVARRATTGKSQIAVFREVAADLEWGPDSTALYGDMERGTRPPTPNDGVRLSLERRSNRIIRLDRFGVIELGRDFFVAIALQEVGARSWHWPAN